MPAQEAKEDGDENHEGNGGERLEVAGLQQHVDDETVEDIDAVGDVVPPEELAGDGG